MEAIPVEVYAAAQVRAMDRYAIEQADIPGYTLMQRAGAAALATLRRRWPGVTAVAVLCGSGNNAGDGYVLAGLARAAGLKVKVCALTDPDRLRGDAARAFADFAAAGGSHESFDPSALRGNGLVVDALLGTGVDRPVVGTLRDCIDAVNASGLPVLALDVPSGLDADTGLPHGAAIRATCTITFVGLKSGLYLGAAADHVGTLEFSGLDIPSAAHAAQPPVMRRIDATVLAAALPPRRRGAHKGEHGRVLIIGGFAMAGAARLAARRRCARRGPRQHCDYRRECRCDRRRTAGTDLPCPALRHRPAAIARCRGCSRDRSGTRTRPRHAEISCRSR
jgi:NAD(P)H-hydrate epimerase